MVRRRALEVLNRLPGEHLEPYAHDFVKLLDQTAYKGIRLEAPGSCGKEPVWLVFRPLVGLRTLEETHNDSAQDPKVAESSHVYYHLSVAMLVWSDIYRSLNPRQCWLWVSCLPQLSSPSPRPWRAAWRTRTKQCEMQPVEF